MVNSTGACRLAATVCPASMFFRITVPFTGARMMVRSRSTCACLSSASRCLTVACALAICDALTSICASTAFSCSRVESCRVRALSSSAGEMKFFSTSIFLRLRSRSASARFTLTRPTSALCAASAETATATALRAASTSARVWLTRNSKLCGSMRAMTWSFFTCVLKSAKISSTWPETWEPTWTVVTAASVPLATTTAWIGPRSSFATRYFVSPVALRAAYQAQPPPARTSSTSAAMVLPRVIFIVVAASFPCAAIVA